MHWGTVGDVIQQVKPTPHQRQCSVGIYEGHLLLMSLFFTTLVSGDVYFKCNFLTFG